LPEEGFPSNVVSLLFPLEVQMRRLLPSVTLLLLLVVLPNAAEAQSARFDTFPDAKPTAGELAPDFTLITLEGETFNLHQVAADRPIVLEFGSFT
jgi:hypothetical protein